MDIQQLTDLITANDFDKLKEAFEVNKDVNAIKAALEQYDPKKHEVHDDAMDKRPDKYLYDVVKDSQGNEQRVLSGIVPAWRLSIPVQKKIVLLAAAFLGSPEIECTPQEGIETDFLDIIEKIWDDNKLDYRFKKIAKIVMSEKECAELWYTQEAEDGYWQDFNINTKAKLRMRLLHNSYDPVTRTGSDSLYPVFDLYGDMIAFGRGYKVTEGETQTEHFDVYTKDRFYFTKKVNGGEWEINTEAVEVLNEEGQKVNGTIAGIKNPVGKIPVIYYAQPLTEWDDVQEMIDRLETKISNHADTNDYYDSPILFAEGKVEGFGDRGQRGKVIEGEQGAKVSYLTWNNLPESTKMEIDNLQKFIFSFTHTPDVSFENLKNLGYFSTIALKTMFMDAHMKAADKEELFGECVLRRLNYLKAAIITMDNRYKAAMRLKAKPKFTFFMPKNIMEEIEMLQKAKNAGLISEQTAVKLSPLTENHDEELALIQDEQAQKQANDLAKAQATSKVVAAQMSN